MLFNSYTFLFAFLPIVLGVWWALPAAEHRIAFLCVASLVFYAWWDIRYVPLLLGALVGDHTAAIAVSRATSPRHRRAILWAGIGANIALLAVFKYATLMMDSGNVLTRAVGLHQPFPELRIVLPLGVGFFTLNGISYLVDVYRGVSEPADKFRSFVAFLAMFPHLIAGPIVRFADIGPQLATLPTRLSREMAGRGLTFIAIGLLKKLIVADHLAPTVDGFYAHADGLTVTSGWMAGAGYALQLYFDFSAYSDIAIGLALLLGIEFPANFDAPFQSRNISEFWRRWHITLGAWFRDYVYFPLGGRRRRPGRAAFNVLFVMTLVGLWHGPSVTFAIYGLYNGVLMVGHAVAQSRGWLPSNAFLARAATLALVIFGAPMFAAGHLGIAMDVYRGMLGFNGIRGGVNVTLGFALAVGGLLAYTQVAPDTWKIAFSPRLGLRAAYVLGIAGGIAILGLGSPSPFLYFQF